MAPASRNLRTMKASFLTGIPSRAYEPAVVGMPNSSSVAILSLMETKIHITRQLFFKQNVESDPAMQTHLTTIGTPHNGFLSQSTHPLDR
jgi:hypothetical protein